MAGAIFAFLRHCQVARRNVIVDLVTPKGNSRAKAPLDAGNLLFTAIAALLTPRARRDCDRSDHQTKMAGAGVVGADSQGLALCGAVPGPTSSG
jgi:hypothetical protein